MRMKYKIGGEINGTKVVREQVGGNRTGERSSDNSDFTHCSSVAAIAITRYSASMEERATVRCFVELQEIGLTPRKIRKAPVEIRLSHPRPQPRQIKGARNYTRTLYLLFQTLVVTSLITESKYHIQIYKNKTTTVVVFTVLIHTVLSPIYIYIYKNCTLHLHDQSAKPTGDGPLQACWPSSMRKIADVLLCTYKD